MPLYYMYACNIFHLFFDAFTENNKPFIHRVRKKKYWIFRLNKIAEENDAERRKHLAWMLILLYMWLWWSLAWEINCLWRCLKNKKIKHSSLFRNNTVLHITLVPKHQTFQWIGSMKEKVHVLGVPICFHTTVDGIIS